MKSTLWSQCGCLAAMTLAGGWGRTLALPAGLPLDCDVTQYYDVGTRACRDCVTLCVQYGAEGPTGHSGPSAGAVETDTRCIELCPDFPYGQAPGPPETHAEAVTAALLEGSLVGLAIALVIIVAVVVVILRRRVYPVVKHWCQVAGGHGKGGLAFTKDSASASVLSVFMDDIDDSSPHDSSYIKLADPSDEVEIIDRVTCV